MQQIEWLPSVFLNYEFKPINESVIYALVHAEARNADLTVGESPLFGGGQV